MARKKKNPIDDNNKESNDSNDDNAKSKKKRASKKEKPIKEESSKEENVSNGRFKFSDTNENGKYPNELARISFSSTNKRITNVDVAKKHNNNVAEREPTNEELNAIQTEANNCDVTITPGTESLWKNLALGKINICYAQIGITFDDRPVIDHDLLVTTLVTYGYPVDTALDFISDFIEQTKDDNSSPIIMINSHMQDITQCIEPLENI